MWYVCVIKCNIILAKLIANAITHCTTTHTQPIYYCKIVKLNDLVAAAAAAAAAAATATKILQIFSIYIYCATINYKNNKHWCCE